MATWASLASNELVAGSELQNAVDTGVFVAKGPTIPNNLECLVKSQANDLVYLANTLSGNEESVKSDYVPSTFVNKGKPDNGTRICNNADYIFVSDQTRHRVLRYPIAGGKGVVIAGTEVSGSGTYLLNNPTGLDIVDNYLVISDTGNRRIVSCDALGEPGNNPLTTIFDLVAKGASYTYPWNVAIQVYAPESGIPSIVATIATETFLAGGPTTEEVPGATVNSQYILCFHNIITNTLIREDYQESIQPSSGSLVEPTLNRFVGIRFGRVNELYQTKTMTSFGRVDVIRWTVTATSASAGANEVYNPTLPTNPAEPWAGPMGTPPSKHGFALSRYNSGEEIYSITGMSYYEINHGSFTTFIGYITVYQKNAPYETYSFIETPQYRSESPTGNFNFSTRALSTLRNPGNPSISPNVKIYILAGLKTDTVFDRVFMLETNPGGSTTGTEIPIGI